MDACLLAVERYGQIQVSKAKPTDDKYQQYYDFSCPMTRVMDHQVLAIRRGVDQKALKLSYEVTAEQMERVIRKTLRGNGKLWNEAIHNAWTRLMRKRSTTRLWSQLCHRADDRAMEVFCDNLTKALLAPPNHAPGGVLALDPGFAAGIKCALLSGNGQVISHPKALSTVPFVGKEESKGISRLQELLKIMQDVDETKETPVVVAVGNGHGTHQAVKLVTEASNACNIPIRIQMVNEAGASVWSVTPSAKDEFPDQPPAAVAAVSIGRRYLNPLAELVKIPPKSLGLGMYQHDVVGRLDEKLDLTAVDCVAAVGVDANACSVEILAKVPGLTAALARKLVQARPLKSRQDLFRIAGLGPKTFEYCSAFVRIIHEDGEEELDATLCHPESYELARYLLKKLKWKLKDPSSVQEQVPKERKDLVEKAAERFDVSEDRVLSVLDHLLHSITQPDPRLRGKPQKQQQASAFGQTNGCSHLPSMGLDALKEACPVRNVLATVRNVLDFGCFVDYGGENDTLVHRSKLGNVPLHSLLVGQEIGIDILGVAANGKISASLSGLGLPAENLDDLKKKRPSSQKSSKGGPKNKRQRQR
jgi:uncharacterized protein